MNGFRNYNWMKKFKRNLSFEDLDLIKEFDIHFNKKNNIFIIFKSKPTIMLLIEVNPLDGKIVSE